jgi:hypothetical protein
MRTNLGAQLRLERFDPLLVEPAGRTGPRLVPPSNCAPWSYRPLCAVPAVEPAPVTLLGLPIARVAHSRIPHLSSRRA